MPFNFKKDLFSLLNENNAKSIGFSGEPTKTIYNDTTEAPPFLIPIPFTSGSINYLDAKQVLEPDPDLLYNSLPPEKRTNLAQNPLADIPKTKDLPLGSTSPGVKTPEVQVPPMPTSTTQLPNQVPNVVQAYLMKSFVPGMKHLPLTPFVRSDVKGLPQPPEVVEQNPGWLQRNWKEVGLFGLGAGGTALLMYLLRNQLNDKKKLKKKVKEEDEDLEE